LNLKKQPVQPYRIIFFFWLLFFITPGFSVEGAHLRKVPVKRAQPSGFIANGTNDGLNISDMESAGSTPSFAMVSPSAENCYVQDPGFESSDVNNFPDFSPYWDEYVDLYNDTPITNISLDGPYSHSGNWWVWFGGYLEGDSAGIKQDVRFPAGGKATLNFFLAIPEAETAGDLKVKIDGNLLFEATEADIDSYTDYTLVSLDVSAYADGGDHQLIFESTIAGGGFTSFLVDDICVTVTTPDGAAVIPWMLLLLLY